MKYSQFLVFSIHANQKSHNWIVTEQELFKLKLGYYKISKNSTKKIIRNSISSNFVNLVGSTCFFLQPKEPKVSRYNIFQRLDFTLLAIKLNQKIYAPRQLKTIRSFDYKKTISVFYQFLLTNTKYPME